MRRFFPSFALAISCLASACSKASLPSEDGPNDPPGANTGNSGLTPSQQADWKAIEQLEAQAKAIARIDGCASSAECRTAPVGSRGCGGPRYYMPWCAKTTDSASLYGKLAEVEKAERDYNKKYQIASTCEMRMPPLVESAGGSCVVK